MDTVNNKFIYADAGKCIGCLNCELACSASHMGINIEAAYDLLVDGEVIIPARNLVIKVARLTAPTQCLQCEDAPCLKACPINIIRLEDGVVKYYEDDCIGCKSCAMVCPFGAVVMAPNTKNDAPVSKLVALTCDLCGGASEKQACVDICPADAITLIDYQIFKEIKLRKHAEKEFQDA